MTASKTAVTNPSDKHVNGHTDKTTYGTATSKTGTDSHGESNASDDHLNIRNDGRGSVSNGGSYTTHTLPMSMTRLGPLPRRLETPLRAQTVDAT